MHTMGYKKDPIQCMVRREPSSAKGTVVYSLFLEAQSKFLMGASQSRSTFQAMGLNRAAHYTISLDQQVSLPGLIRISWHGLLHVPQTHT